MFPAKCGDDKTTLRGSSLPPCSSGTHLAGDSSVTFRVGVITSDKGYVNQKSAEVNNLVPKKSQKGSKLRERSENDQVSPPVVPRSGSIMSLRRITFMANLTDRLLAGSRSHLIEEDRFQGGG